MYNLGFIAWHPEPPLLAAPYNIMWRPAMPAVRIGPDSAAMHHGWEPVLGNAKAKSTLATLTFVHPSGGSFETRRVLERCSFTYCAAGETTSALELTEKCHAIKKDCK